MVADRAAEQGKVKPEPDGVSAMPVLAFDLVGVHIQPIDSTTFNQSYVEIPNLGALQNDHNTTILTIRSFTNSTDMEKL
jgi:hypothetical protein